MIIDCDLCAMQHTSACDDCAVAFLLDVAPPVEFFDAEVAALDQLARAGLVAPLRLVPRPRDSVPAPSGADQPNREGEGKSLGGSMKG